MFGVEYHPHYICTLLPNLGFASQTACLVSDPLDEAKRLAWCHQTWPAVLKCARQRQALLLFGDEASLAQWGSLRYTWAPKGPQPAVPPSGIRKAYKVFGLIDYFSGRFFAQAHTGRCNSESYAAFLLDGLAQTKPACLCHSTGCATTPATPWRSFLRPMSRVSPKCHCPPLRRILIPSNSCGRQSRRWRRI